MQDELLIQKTRIPDIKEKFRHSFISFANIDTSLKLSDDEHLQCSETLAALEECEKLDISEVSYGDTINNLRDFLDQFTLITPIQNFNNNLAESKTKLSDFLKHSAWQLKELQIALKTRTFASGILASYKKEFEDLKAKVDDSLKSDRAEYGQLHNDMKSALSNAEKKLNNLEVGANAIHFKKIADGQMSLVRFWLIVMILLIILFSLVAYYNFTQPFPAITSQWQFYWLISTKLPIAFLLTFLLIFSSKNYRASKHNELANRHRQHCISTAKDFIDTSSNDQFKLDVMLKVMDTTFAGNNTGFVHDSSQSDSPLAFVKNNIMDGKQ